MQNKNIKLRQTETRRRQDYGGQVGEIPKDWKIARLVDYVDIDPQRSLKKGTTAKCIPMANIQPYEKKIYSYEEKPYNGGSRFINGDTLLARITPCLENGKIAYWQYCPN